MSLLLLLACASDDKLPADDTAASGDTADSGDTGADTDAIDPRFAALAAAIEADLLASLATGASVAVYQDGAIVFARGFGSGDPDGDQPIATTTLFQIGSTTKMYTATLLLQKVEDGTLSLDDTLADAVPALEFALDDSWNDAIHLRHLLSHTGGLYDYVPWDGDSDDAALADFTYGDYAANLFAMNAPGQFWNYSNPNFTLAGLATEVADTRMWPDILVEDLLRPLGMDRSTARKADVLADGDYALGYGYTNLTTGAMGTVSMRNVPDPAWVRPAGMIWSTPTEMIEMAKFLMDGDPAVLSDTLRAGITAEQVPLGYLPEVQHYGYGMFVDRGFSLGADWYDVPIWNHGGNTLSFTSTFYVVPDQDFAIAILSNGFGDNFNGSVAAAFASLLTLPAPSASPPAYTFDPAGLDAHVGAYLDAYNVGDVTVTREGDVLYVDMPVLDEYGYTYERALEPIGTDLWILTLDGTPLDLTFLDASDGTDSVYIRNRSFVVTRVGESEPAALAATPPPSSPSPSSPRPTREAVAAWVAKAKLDAVMDGSRALRGQ
ncbi:MAG: serine hydrolase domain-containing protein [Pseudomonadota bacterium]|nr:serine hydrolase domain-containing protein [Pseudomonadota bacterium]